MKNSIVCIFFLLAIPACAAENRLVPGKSVGQISLGENLDSVYQKQDQSDSGDGALGHFWDNWYSCSSSPQTVKREVLEIYSVRTVSGAQTVVEQIRVTSPWFSTTNGITTRSFLVQIQRAFPQARAMAFYHSAALHSRVTVYDEIKQGIAFEISSDGRCLAITIHRQGNQVAHSFVARHDYQPIK